MTEVSSCKFCSAIAVDERLDFVKELESELFVAVWDAYPVTPGHMLIIPKRHAPRMEDLTDGEQADLVSMVLTAKKFIAAYDLRNLYTRMHAHHAGNETAQAFIRSCLNRLEQRSDSPDAFNDGVNDGLAAGQTIAHFHWHIMPRWLDDIADPVGGVRGIFPNKRDYTRS